MATSDRVVEDIVAYVASFTGGKLPIRFDPALHQLGAHRREEDLSPISGALRWDPEGATIVVNAREAKTRHRFTIGHEIGHLVLGSRHLAAGLGLDGVALSRLEEERVCDRVAAELLMPRSAVVPRTGTLLDLTQIDALARDAWVSRSAAAARLIEVGRYPDVLMVWRCTRGTWEVVNVIGAPRASRLSLDPVDGVDVHPFDSLAVGRITDLSVGIRLGADEYLEASSQLRRVGDTVAMLAYGLSARLWSLKSGSAGPLLRQSTQGTDSRERYRADRTCLPSEGIARGATG